MTNYDRLTKNYNEVFEYFSIPKNETKSYFEESINNLYFTGEVDTGYYFETCFVDAKNAVKYRGIKDGYFYILPRNSDELINHKIDAFAISVSDKFKKISKEDDKFIIEVYDPNKKLVNIKFYDMSAILKLEEKKMDYASIDYIELDLNRFGIRPSKECNVYNSNGKVLLDVLDSEEEDKILADRDFDYPFYQEYLDYFDKDKQGKNLKSKGFRL